MIMRVHQKSGENVQTEYKVVLVDLADRRKSKDNDNVLN